MILTWPLTNPFLPNIGTAGRDMDFTRRFQPEFGPPIERPGTTASMQEWSMSVVVRAADCVTLRAWWNDTLVRGTLPFLWRHPQSRDVTMWKVSGGLQYNTLSSDIFRVSFNSLLMPGTPWFAPYVADPHVRAPRWVADYAGGVFGVDDARGVVGDLAAISGTFEVWRKNTNGSQSFSSVTYAADIPATAPSGVAWLVGFDL